MTAMLGELVELTSPEAKFAEALIGFQAELPAIHKGNTATVKSDKGSFSYDYADLTFITEKAFPLLTKHGFAFMAAPHVRQDGPTVLRCTLLHTGGHFERGDYPLPSGGTPQQLGSAITYGRRYALCAMTGMAPGGEDDDGARASEPRQTAATSPQRETDPVWIGDVEQRITGATTLTDLVGIRAEANRKYEKFALGTADADRLKQAIEQRETELGGGK